MATRKHRKSRKSTKRFRRTRSKRQKGGAGGGNTSGQEVKNPCTICGDSLDNSDDVVTTYCGHQFHNNDHCLKKWCQESDPENMEKLSGNTPCPLCRFNISFTCKMLPLLPQLSDKEKVEINQNPINGLVERIRNGREEVLVEATIVVRK